MTDLVKVAKWFSGRDTGMSSEAIAWHMTAGWCAGDYPHDPADLGRCLRLLRHFPEWVGRINEMAKYGLQWRALTKNWQKLSAVMESEVGIDWEKAKTAPETYRAMKETMGQGK